MLALFSYECFDGCSARKPLENGEMATAVDGLRSENNPVRTYSEGKRIMTPSHVSSHAKVTAALCEPEQRVRVKPRSRLSP